MEDEEIDYEIEEEHTAAYYTIICAQLVDLLLSNQEIELNAIM